ncbi:hypothetical protein C474_10296 [Halogeometricum pallidum JCM 14848]|uniref:Uncharacterized protein n=1 Tax=Halogeometricum pallidum JCM 14848 TaxID=1227487 RepID=M0D9K8_HALPD|nr:hypothetical protein [Halogeometricum pallidum]ELZ30844.1 hypothetical protein C474_10296 [Halogeometricum pallidum JCM 14848]
MSLFESSQSNAASQQNQQSNQAQLEEAKGTDLFLFASLASIAFSMYEYYVKGDTERALFVGQWPQTILAMALYLRQRRQNN